MLRLDPNASVLLLLASLLPGAASAIELRDAELAAGAKPVLQNVNNLLKTNGKYVRAGSCH